MIKLLLLTNWQIVACCIILLIVLFVLAVVISCIIVITKDYDDQYPDPNEGGIKL